MDKIWVLRQSLTERRERGKINKPQKCSYCKSPATKAYLWVEGMAYIPACDSCGKKARHQIEVTNKDEVVSVRDIPQK